MEKRLCEAGKEEVGSMTAMVRHKEVGPAKRAGARINMYREW